MPETYALRQYYPNPFHSCTRIEYSLAEAGKVKLAVYDLLGREVAILVNQHQPAGYYEVTFDGRDLASGIYIYRLEAGAYVANKKLVLVR
ncbi:MAG: T9SS type A sorting domain-containing protein [candidate division KSB1 bacterium]|nr:T9SS type A sorting domain-containing protein [candidate division KSB1 bacterium]MDZ7376106.1 T9SS type A sorting domain-containing protein [candidate division KSB1 bacterium]